MSNQGFPKQLLDTRTPEVDDLLRRTARPVSDSHPCSSAIGAIFPLTEYLTCASPWLECIEGATDGALEISDTMLWWPGDPGMDSIDGVASLWRPCLLVKIPLSAGSSDVYPAADLDSTGTAGSSDLKPV